jgi:hypothetical protein
VDEFIGELHAEANEAIRGLLRQAYDRGFREALASAGQPVVPAPITPAPLTPAPLTPAPVASVRWVGAAKEAADDASDVGPDEDEVEDEEDERAAGTLEPRPILANAKVGTLRRRIIRMFDLERFAIEVVICRNGDRERRQLKSTARLSLYRRGEG